MVATAHRDYGNKNIVFTIPLNARGGYPIINLILYIVDTR